MKQMMIVLSLIALAAAALFWKQVWGVFAGMTVLQSLEMIVQFILHVAVGTIVVYGVATAPELIKPWMRALRQKQRAQRRGRMIVQTKEPVSKPRRLSTMELLQLMAPEKKIQQTPSAPPDDRTELRF